LDDFRRFRHVERHRYGFELVWENMQELLTDSVRVLDLFITDIEAFCVFLEQLDDTEA
jgi:hypothetical protein